MDKTDKIMFAILVIVILISYIGFSKISDDCAAKNGVLVRTFTGLICIDKGAVK